MRPRERLLDLLDELREVLPPEMDEARTVIATRDRILKDSYERAEQTRHRAVAEAGGMRVTRFVRNPLPSSNFARLDSLVGVARRAP